MPATRLSEARGDVDVLHTSELWQRPTHGTLDVEVRVPRAKDDTRAFRMHRASGRRASLTT